VTEKLRLRHRLEPRHYLSRGIQAQSTSQAKGSFPEASATLTTHLDLAATLRTDAPDVVGRCRKVTVGFSEDQKFLRQLDLVIGKVEAQYETRGRLRKQRDGRGVHSAQVISDSSPVAQSQADTPGTSSSNLVPAVPMNGTVQPRSFESRQGRKLAGMGPRRATNLVSLLSISAGVMAASCGDRTK
jgi:hypothetical protein